MKFFNKEGRQPMSKKTKKKIKIIIAAVLVVAVALTAVLVTMKNKGAKAGSEINTATAVIGNVKSAISASGTIEPINMYEVTALVKGDVISAGFEKGDIVNKDDVLYQIDTTEMQNTLEKAKLSMEKTRDSYNDTLENVAKLNVKAPIDGVISQMYVKKGDNVSNGTKICDIINKSKMVLTIPFNAVDAPSLYVGQQADVTLENSFYTTYGTISRVSTGALTNENNVSVSYVDIEVVNPGGINKGDTATAVAGGIACNTAGTFDYYATKTVTAEVAGEITKINDGMGNQVNEGGIIAVIESDSVKDSLKDSNRSLREAEISLQNTYEQLDDYTIKAPIQGTIIEKNVKAGDKIDNTSSSKTLCVIADLSTIIFTINVDELDIDKIELNQRVDITADALPNKRFDGFVNNISINGSTSNGVTTYPVEIVVNTPEGLLPGMNVNAEIVIAEKSNVITVPVSAVMRGNTVYVKDDKGASKKEEGEKGRMNAVPEGFRAVKVTTGLNDDNNIEITEGLSEGDVVYVRVQTTTTTNQMMQGGMPGGGMMGGGMPGGGMTGGMQGGNRSQGGMR